MVSDVRWAVIQVVESTVRYSRMKEVIGQPPLFQPTRLSLALVELILVKSSCSLANCGSEIERRAQHVKKFQSQPAEKTIHGHKSTSSQEYVQE